MIYPSFGISIFAHLFVILTVKIKNFFSFGKNKETLYKKEFINKKNVYKNIFASLAIAAIIETVSFLVIGSSIAAAYVGAISDKSNLNVIESVIHSFTIKKNSSICTKDKICYIEIKNIYSEANALLG